MVRMVMMEIAACPCRDRPHTWPRYLGKAVSMPKLCPPPPHMPFFFFFFEAYSVVQKLCTLQSTE